MGSGRNGGEAAGSRLPSGTPGLCERVRPGRRAQVVNVARCGFAGNEQKQKMQSAGPAQGVLAQPTILVTPACGCRAGQGGPRPSPAPTARDRRRSRRPAPAQVRRPGEETAARRLRRCGGQARDRCPLSRRCGGRAGDRRPPSRRCSGRARRPPPAAPATPVHRRLKPAAGTAGSPPSRTVHGARHIAKRRTSSSPCADPAAERMPVVREGGLRVVVAAISIALPAATVAPLQPPGRHLP
jgi:hypothetical protein